VLTTFCWVKIARLRGPDVQVAEEGLVPAGERNMAIVAGTPTLMPTMPAFTRCLNSRAALPLL